VQSTHDKAMAFGRTRYSDEIRRARRDPEWIESGTPGVLRHVLGGNLIRLTVEGWVSVRRDMTPVRRAAAPELEASP
jgi:hypothetical protein